MSFAVTIESRLRGATTFPLRYIFRSEALPVKSNQVQVPTKTQQFQIYPYEQRLWKVPYLNNVAGQCSVESFIR